MKEIYTNRKCGIELPDKNPNKRPNDSIDITIGVFFDGTGNNKYNVYFNQRAKEQFKKGYEAYMDKKGQKKYKPSKGYDSYKSGYSNVAILWEMYDTSIPYQEKVYIEGPGTEAPVGGSRYFDEEEGLSSSGKGDSVVIGEGLGMGDTGIDAKVDRAFKVIEDKVLSIYNNMNKKIIKSITFDVFGFSRGATESRIFARKIFVKNNLLSKKLKSCNINRANEIEYYINFLGLFDTVASHKTRVLYDSSKDESLYIPQNVSMVVHLVAADDYRCYFPLTTVSSAYEKEKKCIEYALPGAHSDIGGGYADAEKEILYMGSKFPSQKTIHDKDSKDFRGYISLTDLRDRQWISVSDYNKAIEYYIKKPMSLDAPCRNVKNHYARIPLKIMHQVAVDNDLDFRVTDGTKKYQEIPPEDKELIHVARFLMGEFFASRKIYRINVKDWVDERGKEYKMGIDFTYGRWTDKLLKSIRRCFLHLSAEDSISNPATSTGRRVIIQG